MERHISTLESPLIFMYNLQFSPGLVTLKESVIHAAVDTPVLLNISGCRLSRTDEVKWTNNSNIPLAKRKKLVFDIIDQCGCEFQDDGSLLMQKAKTGIYNVSAHDTITGTKKCTGNIRVEVEDPVDRPTIIYKCTEKTVDVQCSISAGTETNVIILWNNKTKGELKGKSHSVPINIKEQPGTVRCVARNTVSEQQQTEEINCPKEWDIYLILSITGGCVAFLIFLILVIYLVKQRPCRHDRRPEQDPMLSCDRTQQNLQQRPLPKPSGQPINVPEHRPNQHPPTPHRQQGPSKPTVRKGKNSNQRRPQPQEQTEKPPGHHEMLTPQPTKPALPANHPNDQAPRPQPRTKSKEPQQHRKTP